MTIGKLLKKIDPDRVGFQFIHEAFIRSKVKNKSRESEYVEVTFGTTEVKVEEFVTFTPSKIGIVLWVDFEDYRKALKE